MPGNSDGLSVSLFEKKLKSKNFNIKYSPYVKIFIMDKLIKFFKEWRLKLLKFIYSTILGRKYLRKGKCKACGKCCTEIYIRHAKNFIKDEEEFERLKQLHYFYNYLEIVDKNDLGLIFACTKLDGETGKCTAYSSRAVICRTYPQEDIFMLGGYISEECGFYFEPINTFEEVFNKVTKKNRR